MMERFRGWTERLSAHTTDVFHTSSTPSEILRAPEVKEIMKILQVWG